MRIILFNTTSEIFFKKDYGYSLGLAYLHSVLQAAGHQVWIFDYFNRPWKEAKKMVSENIIKYDPDIVGVSCLSGNRLSSMEALKIAKEINPDVITIAGGVHATTLYEQLLLNYPLDVVVRGEAEETIVDLANAFKHGISFSQVKGIAFREGQNVSLPGPREPIIDLDVIPFPSHEPFRPYIEQSKKVSIITSRGCPHKCSFCSSSSYWGTSYRARSSKNVVDEIEKLINDFSSVNEVIFWDDLFTLDPQRVIDICKDILARKLNFQWVCQGHVRSLNEEMLIWMKRAGCYSVSLGVESGSPHVLEKIGKKITIEQIERAFDLLDSRGIRGTAFLMVGNPGETERTIDETIGLIKRAKIKEISSVTICQIYPNTSLYELAKNKGFITDDYWLWRNPVPYCTLEHPLRRLKKFYYKIVIAFYKNQGLSNLMRNVVIKSFRANPAQFITKVITNMFWLIKSLLFTR